MIKILRLDSTWIIAEVEEIPAVEIGDPDCVLKSPYEIINGELKRYPPHSKDEEIIVRSSDVFVITEPDDDILKLYNDR